MKQTKKRDFSWLQIIIGLLVSAVFVYFTFRSLDFAAILRMLFAVRPLPVIASVAIVCVVFILRALRWRYFIPSEAKVCTATLISATYIGFMANSILPAKMGEIVRPYMLGKKDGISKTSAFASVVVERIFDGLCIVVMILVLSFITPDIDRNIARFFPALHVDIRLFALALFLIFAALLSVMLFLRLKRAFSFRVLGYLLTPLPFRFKTAIENVLHKFTDGIGFSPHPLAPLFIALYTIAYWAIIGVQLMLLLYAFDFGATLALPYIAALWVMTLSGLGIAIPSAPGNIGTFEFMTIFALVLCGVDANAAASYALLSHGIALVPVVIIGLVFFILSGVRLTEARAL